MDFEKARFNMVEQQIRPWQVLAPEVLETLSLVKRERFVAPEHQPLAFADIELPTACGQAMLPPKIEARALQALALRNTDTVLEVGSGSGHMAALLAARAEWVRSIEIEPALVRLAHDNLARNAVDNVIVEEGDGSAGWAERAPYDAIMISGALPTVPDALLHQLKPGGRLFVFVGQAPVMQARLFTCTAEGQFRQQDVFEWLAPALKLPAALPRFRF